MKGSSQAVAPHALCAPEAILCVPQVQCCTVHCCRLPVRLPWQCWSASLILQRARDHPGIFLPQTVSWRRGDPVVCRVDLAMWGCTDPAVAGPSKGEAVAQPLEPGWLHSAPGSAASSAVGLGQAACLPRAQCPLLQSENDHRPRGVRQR